MHDAELRGGVVIDVWVAPLDVAPATRAALEAGLTEVERGRAARYRAPADARRFSAARGWLRQVLGAALGVEPGAVALSQGPGKPRLADRAGPRFNLSHAGALALIAVAEQEVGVDVEPVAGAGRWADVVDLVCSAGEAAALRRLPPEEQSAAFLRAWTAKEAYLKATGTGLTVPPDGVEVGDLDGAGAIGGAEAAGRAGGGARHAAWTAGCASGFEAGHPLAPRAGGPPERVRVAGDAGPPRWFVRALRPAPGYVGAVAAEGDRWDARLRGMDELAVRVPSRAGAGR